MQQCALVAQFETNARRRSAQFTIFGGALGLTGAVQLRTSAEKTYVGFRWVLANSRDAATAVLHRIEIGRGFTVLWAAFAVLASFLFFVVILVSTEADVVVEEELAGDHAAVRALDAARPS